MLLCQNIFDQDRAAKFEKCNYTIISCLVYNLLAFIFNLIFFVLLLVYHFCILYTLTIEECHLRLLKQAPVVFLKMADHLLHRLVDHVVGYLHGLLRLFYRRGDDVVVTVACCTSPYLTVIGVALTLRIGIHKIRFEDHFVCSLELRSALALYFKLKVYENGLWSRLLLRCLFPSGLLGVYSLLGTL